MKTYNALHEGFEKEERAAATVSGTVAALARDLRAKPDFANLKPRVQRDYGFYLDDIQETFDRVRVPAVKKCVVLEWRDSTVATPTKANYALSVLTLVMVEHYTRGAQQKLLAKEAINKLQANGKAQKVNNHKSREWTIWPEPPRKRKPSH